MRLATCFSLKWPSSCASTASISSAASRASSVSKNTMRLAVPKPVKYALPWPERFDPSITNRPGAAEAAAGEQRLDARARGSSPIGVNLLNSGAISVG